VCCSVSHQCVLQCVLQYVLLIKSGKTSRVIAVLFSVCVWKRVMQCYSLVCVAVCVAACVAVCVAVCVVDKEWKGFSRDCGTLQCECVAACVAACVAVCVSVFLISVCCSVCCSMCC